MMDLNNILPYDGEVLYVDNFLEPCQADEYFKIFMHSIAWKPDEAIIMGKHIITKRKVAWYADLPFDYSYSNISRRALPWTSELLKLKQQVSSELNETFNSCLMNLYPTGLEGVGWHSDNEKQLKPNACIASLSLGVARKFSFKHRKTKQSISILLNPGSLLLMKGITQSHWVHCLPPTKKVHTTRINLTYRSYVNP